MKKNESHAERMIESLLIFSVRNMTEAGGICFCDCEFASARLAFFPLSQR